MPPEPFRIPLTGWADAQLAELTRVTRSDQIAALGGATLLGERAALNGFKVPGQVSAGGGCRMVAALDGTIALNLSRPDDRELLPALFGEAEFDAGNDFAVAKQILTRPVADLIERGRTLGLAIAEIDEAPASPASAVTKTGGQRVRKSRPLVIDLSTLWAGPLAAHLLWLSGAEVIKVESRNRPDSMRDGGSELFALINQGKANVALDLHEAEGRAALLTLIRRADVVIESARLRALLQLGIDADALVREEPGLVWVTITGHGAQGAAANWIGFGDDTAVAGGLSAALRDATGQLGFVGDAIGDPLSGIYAANVAAKGLAAGQAARQIVSMSGVVSAAITATDPASLRRDLIAWAAHQGQPFPTVASRQNGAVAARGEGNARFLT